MKQERVERPAKQTRDEYQELADLPVQDVAPLKGDLDSLLDEVDQVLEENAQEFVDAYVQKGGE